MYRTICINAHRHTQMYTSYRRILGPMFCFALLFLHFNHTKLMDRGLPTSNQVNSKSDRWASLQTTGWCGNLTNDYKVLLDCFRAYWIVGDSYFHARRKVRLGFSQPYCYSMYLLPSKVAIDYIHVPQVNHNTTVVMVVVFDIKRVIWVFHKLYEKRDIPNGQKEERGSSVKTLRNCGKTRIPRIIINLYALRDWKEPYTNNNNNSELIA